MNRPLLAFFSLLLLSSSAFATAAVPSSFADLAAQSVPGVVNISTKQIVHHDSAKNEGGGAAPLFPTLPPGSPFEEFFEQFKEFYDNAPDSEAASLGSGFIIDASGYIVTNNHVVAGAEEITVTFSDESKATAKLIGRDAKTDVALLKVETKKPLQALKWGDSDEARVGDWAMAIGNPFGLGISVSAGIISARARDINSGPFDDFLQTDAAINRGNSGGPLLNMKGEVIGMNTAIFSPSGGSVGIGFAVPATLAKPVIEQLKQFGKTKRGWLGVKIQTVTDEIAENMGLKESHGALVSEVTADSPAGKAGVKVGDVILSFDGKEVSKMRRLPRLVAETHAGKTVPMVLWRDGKQKTLSVTIAELKEETQDSEIANAKEDSSSAKEAESQEIYGLSMATLSPGLRQKFSMKKEKEGVVITAVKKNSAAAKAGIQRGDIISTINQAKVTTANEAVSKLKDASKSGKKTALLLLMRGDATYFITLPLKEEK